MWTCIPSLLGGWVVPVLAWFLCVPATLQEREERRNLCYLS